MFSKCFPKIHIMATTINYFIRKEPRKDGTFAVNIRVIHNRQQRRLPTSIYLRKGQLSRDLSTIKDLHADEIVTNKVMELRNRLMDVSHAEYMSIDQIIAIITRPTVEAFRLDLFDFAAGRMESMEPKTAESYATALNAVERFIGRRKLDFNEITGTWVRRFRDFLENEPALTGDKGNTYKKKGKGTRAIGSYLASLRALHNQARNIYNDDDTGTIYIPRQPFGKGVIPRQPVTEHRVLSVAGIHALMMTKPKPGSRAEMAKDMFMLSFSLAGTNTVDLYQLKKSDIVGDLLTYDRAKTDSRRYDKARITLKVPPLASEIISRYTGEGKQLLCFADRYRNAHDFNRAINIGLKDVAKLTADDEVKLTELDTPLTSYYARHSWATIARNVCRIDFDTVNAALNHVHQGTDRIGDIYIARDYSAIWDAQEKVLAEVTNAKTHQVLSNILKTG